VILELTSLVFIKKNLATKKANFRNLNPLLQKGYWVSQSQNYVMIISLGTLVFFFSKIERQRMLIAANGRNRLPYWQKKFHCWFWEPRKKSWTWYQCRVWNTDTDIWKTSFVTRANIKGQIILIVTILSHWFINGRWGERV